jgi:hypothetical protein
MSEIKKEIGVKAFIDDKEIDPETIKVEMSYGEQKADVDLKQAVIRSMLLAQENFILKQALSELQAAMYGPGEGTIATPSDKKIVLPGDA